MWYRKNFLLIIELLPVYTRVLYYIKQVINHFCIPINCLSSMFKFPLCCLLPIQSSNLSLLSYKLNSDLTELSLLGTSLFFLIVTLHCPLSTFSNRKFFPCKSLHLGFLYSIRTHKIKEFLISRLCVHFKLDIEFTIPSGTSLEL